MEDQLFIPYIIFIGRLQPCSHHGGQPEASKGNKIEKPEDGLSVNWVSTILWLPMIPRSSIRFFHPQDPQKSDQTSTSPLILLPSFMVPGIKIYLAAFGASWSLRIVWEIQREKVLGRLFDLLEFCDLTSRGVWMELSHWRFKTTPDCSRRPKMRWVVKVLGIWKLSWYGVTLGPVRYFVSCWKKSSAL